MLSIPTLPKYMVDSVPGHCLHVRVTFFVVVFFVLLFFLLQNAPIDMIFDDAIYLLIYFLHFISMLLRPSPILKTFQKMGERNEKKFYNSKQIIIILPM